MFLSMYDNKEMKKFKTDDLHYILGLYISNNIVVPPKCPVCGEYVYIDADTGLGQCSHCNHIGKVYTSSKLIFTRDWSVLSC